MSLPTDKNDKLLGTMKLFCIQLQVQDGIKLVLNERMKEYVALGMQGKKPNETTALHEILKRGIEVVLNNPKPVPTWKPTIYNVLKKPKEMIDVVERVVLDRSILPDASKLKK